MTYSEYLKRMSKYFFNAFFIIPLCFLLYVFSHYSIFHFAISGMENGVIMLHCKLLQIWYVYAFHYLLLHHVILYYFVFTSTIFRCEARQTFSTPFPDIKHEYCNENWFLKEFNTISLTSMVSFLFCSMA